MVPFIIFVAGVAVGIGSYKLYDSLKKYPEDMEKNQKEPPQPKSNWIKHQSSDDSSNVNNADFDISPLNHIMSKYGVDITSPNCLYILCNQIKSRTYQCILNDILEHTTTGKDLISFINNIHIETFSFPKATSSIGSVFIPLSTIDILFTESKIAAEVSDPKYKVEMLINMAYASAIDRLKNNFGTEFSKLIRAYEEGRDLQSYYNDIIREIKISRDFISA